MPLFSHEARAAPVTQETGAALWLEVPGDSRRPLALKAEMMTKSGWRDSPVERAAKYFAAAAAATRRGS